MARLRRGGSLLAIARAQFGHFGQQDGGRHGPDPGDALEPGGTRVQPGLRPHQGRQLGGRPARGPRSARRLGGEAQIQVGAVVSALLLLGRAVRDQLTRPAAEDLKVLDGGAGLGTSRGPHCGLEPPQHARVQPVSLGPGMPQARAKSRGWRGLTVTGRPAALSAATTASS